MGPLEMPFCPAGSSPSVKRNGHTHYRKHYDQGKNHFFSPWSVNLRKIRLAMARPVSLPCDSGLHLGCLHVLRN